MTGFTKSLFLLAFASGIVSPLAAEKVTLASARDSVAGQCVEQDADGDRTANISARLLESPVGKPKAAVLSYRGTAIESGDPATNRLLASWIIP